MISMRICDLLGIVHPGAGGIADGRRLAAVLMLGAEGVWMGTRFYASDHICSTLDISRSTLY